MGTKLQCTRTVKFRQRGQKGDKGESIAITLNRDGLYTEVNWNGYATIGHTEYYTKRTGDDDFTNCRVDDYFVVTGTASDSGIRHTATYKCTQVSASVIYGTCVSHIKDGKDGPNVGENLIDGTGTAKVITSSTSAGADGYSKWYSGLWTLNDVNLSANTRYSCQMRIKLENCTGLNGRNIRIHISTKGSPAHYPFICEFNPTANGTYEVKKENFLISYASEGVYNSVTFGWDLSIGGDIGLGTITIDKVKLEAGEKCTAWCLSENDKKGENGADGTGGYVLRGDWQPNTLYYYNTDRRDVVLVNGVKKRVKTRGSFTSRSTFDSTEAARWEDATDIPFASMELILVDVAFIENLIATRVQTDVGMKPRVSIKGADLQIFSKIVDSDNNEIPTFKTEIDSDGAVHFKFLNPSTKVYNDFSFRGFQNSATAESQNAFSVFGQFVKSTSSSDTFQTLCAAWKTSKAPLYSLRVGYDSSGNPRISTTYESKLYTAQNINNVAAAGTYYEFFRQSYGSVFYIGYKLTVNSDGTYSYYKFYHDVNGRHLNIQNVSGGSGYQFGESDKQIAQEYSRTDMMEEPAPQPGGYELAP